jgi:hypothetical protein
MSDLLFKNIEAMTIDVDSKDVRQFTKDLEAIEMNEFVLKDFNSKFRINKAKKTMKVLYRNYKDGTDIVDMVHNLESDIESAFIIKSACRIGYSIIFEDKHSN